MHSKFYFNGTLVVPKRGLNQKPPRRTENLGGAVRFYSIRFQHRMKIFDHIAYQRHIREFTHGGHLQMFYTLTLQAGNPRNCLSNRIVSDFCDNIVKTYDVVNYTWVREYTAQGVPHWHIATVQPFMDDLPTRLNQTWCKVRGYDSPNALRTEPKSGLVVKSPTRAMRYMAKYMTKDTCDYADRYKKYSFYGERAPEPVPDYYNYQARLECKHDGDYARIYEGRPNQGHVWLKS